MKDYSELYENNMKTLALALDYCEQNYSHEEIIKELALDNDIKKQLCIIELKKINSQEDANILTQNLTGKSGPVREAASYKILELISNNLYKNFFQTKEIINILTKGITDINPTVSRNIIETITYIDNTEYLISNIINEIKITLNNIDDKSKSRSYVNNKKNFNLYWNLEALINIFFNTKARNYTISKSIIESIIEIIKITYKSKDYTIREKTAKLIGIIQYNNSLDGIITALKNDNNIYVRKYFPNN